MDVISRLPAGPDCWMPPRIFDLNRSQDVDELNILSNGGSIRRVCDQVNLALSELYDIQNPNRKDKKTDQEISDYISRLTGAQPEKYGVWVYYPWSGNLVHFPPKDDLRLLRSSRNRNLITAQEQEELYNSTILVVGLSVGSSALEILLSQGVGGKLMLADMDIIEPTNLNRIKSPYHEVGVHKVDALAKRISETDPYIEQVHIKEGLSDNNVQEILSQHLPDVIIDEMDDLRMKLLLREQAAKLRLPVIMATDDGENAILDIERYDKDAHQKPFEGRIPEEILNKIIKGELSRPELGIMIGKYFVGAEHIPLRMFESLMEVGKTIPSWPQLAGAATLSGVTLTYAAKKIILDQPLKPGRHIFDMDVELDPVISTAEHRQKLEQFQKLFFA